MGVSLRSNLLEQILSPANLNAAYKQVMRNKGTAGIDSMDCARPLGYLLEQKDVLTESIRQRTYRPNPVRRAGYTWIGCYYSASALPKGCGTAVCGIACTVV